MAGSDTNNFSSSSPHRLPTLSASQALQNLSSTPRRPISTGLRRLDAALQGRDYESSSQDDLLGGISRGEVTEVYGPPGVGKTAFAIQLSTHALHAGGSVVWVGKEFFGPSAHTHVMFHLLMADMADASCQLVGPRLKEIIEHTQISGKQPASSQSVFQARLNNLYHFTTPTLPHLLALLTHQSTSFPPLNTSLIVIDSVSTLFALAFPKILENADILQTPAKKSDAVQWSAGRRWAVMGEFMSRIGKLAATSNIAILLTSQATTRIKYETRAVLHPAISGNAWDSGIGARLVLFRDWLFRGPETSSSRGEYVPGVRFAGVMKAKGVTYEGVGKAITFTIEEHGLHETIYDRAEIRLNISPDLPTTSMKRKRGEIADSESEDEEAASDQEFDWAEGDNALNAEALLD